MGNGFGRRAKGEDLDAAREEALGWARERLDEGVPLIGFDLQVHEFAIVTGYDDERRGFHVESAVSEELGGFAPWDDWPSLGIIELFAPTGPSDPDPELAVLGALQTALQLLSGEGGRERAPARGRRRWRRGRRRSMGRERWTGRGNAYMLAVLQAARMDAAAFLRDLAESVPPLAEPLGRAEEAVREVTQALSPLLTLFPFPAGGHGNVANPGLREAAANALRRAAGHERRAAQSIAEAFGMMGAV